MRKTASVLEMVTWANTQLKSTDVAATVDFKAGICSFLETLLFSTDNYNGFSFLYPGANDAGTLGYYSRNYALPKWAK